MDYLVNLIGIEVIKLSAGLIVLIAINIILGGVFSKFEKDFDLGKFLHGIAKAILVIFCFAAVYVVGAVNKDYLSLDLKTGDPIDVMDAMHGVILTGYFFYGKQVINKMGLVLYNKPLFNTETHTQPGKPKQDSFADMETEPLESSIESIPNTIKTSASAPASDLNQDNTVSESLSR